MAVRVLAKKEETEKEEHRNVERDVVVDVGGETFAR